EALRRRLEKRIYIPLPDEEARLGMFKVNCSSIKLADDVDFRRLVKRTEGYSGADICSVCREASMMNLRDRLRKARTKGESGVALDVDRLRAEVEGRPVTMGNFEQAVKNVQKSVGTEDLRNSLIMTMHPLTSGLRDYVTAADHTRYDGLADGFIRVDVTHSNLQARVHDATLSLDAPISSVKQKLYKRNGTTVDHMQLFLRRGDGSTIFLYDDKLTLR
ncbi:Katanin p60 ATPase-containing subunit A1, partial [Perkinsus olseni]